MHVEPHRDNRLIMTKSRGQVMSILLPWFQLKHTTRFAPYLNLSPWVIRVGGRPRVEPLMTRLVRAYPWLPLIQLESTLINFRLTLTRFNSGRHYLFHLFIWRKKLSIQTILATVCSINCPTHKWTKNRNGLSLFNLNRFGRTWILSVHGN